MSHSLTYAVVTPARNEVENLPRVAEALIAQRRRPRRWIIVENGSTDGTRSVADRLAREHDWVHVLGLAGESTPDRGGAVVRAITAALGALGAQPDIFVNVDADVSMDPDYFERLLAAFGADESLGIASGSGYELRRDTWTQLHGTRASVWGATRAYRWACLQDVLPLEERVGWDGIDEIRANAAGWTTRAFLDLPFRHHRREGERDGARARHWREQGALAHFMDYRVSYLLARTLFRAAREPSALAMLLGYAGAAAARSPKCDDRSARAYLRSQQRLRRLPVRRREATGRVSAS